jgi:hypothetical protein
MASNRELSEQARSLAEELGIEAKTVGLGNAQLVDLVAQLQTQVDEKSKPQPIVAEPKSVVYRVALGRQLSTQRGVLKNGDIVQVSDVSDGISQLEKMFAGGFLIKS